MPDDCRNRLPDRPWNRLRLAWTSNQGSYYQLTHLTNSILASPDHLLPLGGGYGCISQACGQCHLALQRLRISYVAITRRNHFRKSTNPSQWILACSPSSSGIGSPDSRYRICCKRWQLRWDLYRAQRSEAEQIENIRPHALADAP